MPVEELLTPECTIDVYHVEYQTMDPAGKITPASGALMVPNDTASQCQGARPIVLYAHGTDPDSAFNIADLEDPDNGKGPDGRGVRGGRLHRGGAELRGLRHLKPGYHPYLNGDQQSEDMIDALTAARSALPTTDAPSTTDSGELLVTGYRRVATSQWQRIERCRRTRGHCGRVRPDVGPLCGFSGPALADAAIFQGQVTGGSPVNLTLLLTSYQNAYGNIYASTEPMPTRRSTPRTSRRCCRAQRR